MAIAAALRMARLGSKSFWLDESASSLLARAGWHTFTTAVVHRQTNMALYYVLLRAWAQFGITDDWLRLLSVVFGLGTIPLIYVVAGKICDAKTARLAALLMSVHVFHIQYSQEARGYSLLVFLTLLSSYFCLRSLTGSSKMMLGIYVVTSVLMLYAHIFGGLILATQWIFWLFAKRTENKSRMAIAVIAISLATSPLLFCMLFLSDRSQLSWMSGSSIPSLYEFLFDLGGRGGAALMILFVALLFTSLRAVLVANAEAIKRLTYLFLWVWLLLPPIVAAAVSFRTPLLQSRYLIICLPAFLILAAHGLASVRSRVVFASGAVALASFLLVAVNSYYRQRANPNSSDDWRDATRYVLSGARPEDAILFPYSAEEIPFRDYLLRSGNNGSQITLAPQETDLQLLTLPGTWTSAELISRAASQHERLWVISSLQPNEHSAAVVNELSARFKNESRINFGFVTILLFDSSVGPSSH